MCWEMNIPSEYTCNQKSTKNAKDCLIFERTKEIYCNNRSKTNKDNSPLAD